MLELEKVCLTCFQQPQSRYWIVQGTESSPIADVLKKHFWFTEDLHQAIICQSCWNQVNSFHQFYASVEELYQHRLVSLVVKCEPEVADSYYLGDTLVEVPDYQRGVRSERQESYTIAKEDDNTMELLVELDDNGVESYATSDVKVSHAFKCDQCPQSFVRQSVYKRHKREHTSDFKCQHCGHIFMFQQTLDRHIKLKHGESPQIVCDVCNQAFQFLSSLLQHKRQFKHGHENIMQCKKCSRWLPDRARWLDHMQRKHNGAEVSCDLCEHVAPNQLALKSHKRRKHDVLNEENHMGVEDAVVAKKEKTSTESTEEVADENEPRQVQSSDKKKSYSRMRKMSFMCGQCPQVFIRQYLLKIHEREHRSSLKCEHCGKSFLLQKRLDVHIKEKHGAESCILVCNVCCKKFSCMALLIQHKLQRKHSHEQIVRCKLCPRRLPDRESLRDHMQRKHHGTEASCDVCGHVASNQLALIAHKRRKHGEQHGENDMGETRLDHKRDVESATPESPIVAKLEETITEAAEEVGDVKTNGFYRKNTFRRHKRQHLNGCKCEHCGKIFKRQGSLDVHIKWKHATANTKVKCEVCCKKFHSSRDLLKHKWRMKHEHEQIVRCKKCSAWLPNRASLRDHMQRKHKITEAACDICDHVASNQHALDAHKRRKHVDQAGDNECMEQTPLDVSSQSAVDISGQSVDVESGSTGCLAKQEETLAETGEEVDDNLNAKVYDFANRKRNFKCNQCPQVFIRKSLYHKHKLSHRIGCKCEHCGQFFKLQSRLDLHIKQKHDVSQERDLKDCTGTALLDVSNYQAEVDSSALTMEDDSIAGTAEDVDIENASAAAHSSDTKESNETKGGNLKCTRCPQSFSSKFAYGKHKQEHRSGSTCEQCGKIFKLESGLKTHIKRKHSAIPSETTCDVCGKTFSCLSLLMLHKWQQKHSHEQILRCKKCSRLLPNRTSLRDHMQRKHNGAEVTCDICGHVAPHQHALDAHKRRKHDEQNLDYSVEASVLQGLFDEKTDVTSEPQECPDVKEVISSTKLAEDINKGESQLHSEQSSEKNKMNETKEKRKFECNQCPQSFKRKSLYKRHTREHVGCCTCEHCGEIFKEQEDLDSHIKRKHGDSTVLTCEVCCRDFTCFASLLRHKWEHEHSHEQIMRCKICSKWLPDRARWRDHMQRRHNGTEATCGICGHVAPNEHALGAHMRRKHEQQDPVEDEEESCDVQETNVTELELEDDVQEKHVTELEDDVQEKHVTQLELKDDVKEKHVTQLELEDDVQESQVTELEIEDDVQENHVTELELEEDVQENHVTELKDGVQKNHVTELKDDVQVKHVTGLELEDDVQENHYTELEDDVQENHVIELELEDDVMESHVTEVEIEDDAQENHVTELELELEEDVQENNVTELEDDVQEKHVTGDKPKYECVQCPEQRFNCEIIYRRHLEEHLGIF